MHVTHSRATVDDDDDGDGARCVFARDAASIAVVVVVVRDDRARVAFGGARGAPWRCGLRIADVAFIARSRRRARRTRGGGARGATSGMR